MAAAQYEQDVEQRAKPEAQSSRNESGGNATPRDLNDVNVSVVDDAASSPPPISRCPVALWNASEPAIFISSQRGGCHAEILHQRVAFGSARATAQTFAEALRYGSRGMAPKNSEQFTYNHEIITK